MHEAIILSVLIFLVAAVFSSVGFAGGSGYLAAMALVDVAPEIMRPTSLLLSILVASIGSVQFHGAGHLPWRKLLPFATGSVPFAFVGGMLSLPDQLYMRIVGLLIVLAACRLWCVPRCSSRIREVDDSRWSYWSYPAHVPSRGPRRDVLQTAQVEQPMNRRIRRIV